MSVRFTCPRCAKSIKAASASAGAPGRCPRCKQTLTVPIAAPLDVLQEVAAVPFLNASMLAPPEQPVMRRRRSHWFVRLLSGVFVSVFTSVAASAICLLLAYFLLPKDSPLRSLFGSLPAALQPQAAVYRAAETRSEPKIDAEALVKAHIVNNAKDNKAEFTKWGPHMSGAELVDLYREGVVVGSPTDAQQAEMKELAGVTLVRVCYRTGGWKLVQVKSYEPGMRNPQPNISTERQPVEVEYDEVFLVQGKSVALSIPQFHNDSYDLHGLPFAKAGDDWKKTYRRELAKTHPAVKIN
jgi:hypothetical protein